MDEIELRIPHDRWAFPQYKIGDEFFDSVLLEPAREERPVTIVTIYPSLLRSKPMIVKTTGNGWALYDTVGPDLRRLLISPLVNSESLVLSATQLNVPARGDRLEPMILPDFFEDRRIEIRDAIRGRRPLPEPTLEGFEQSNIQQIIEEPIYQLSYETLLRQLYNLPILNDLRVELTPFSELSNIQIDRYTIDPLLQPWADLNTSNRIITIFGKNGMTYFVKVQYDPINN